MTFMPSTFHSNPGIENERHGGALYEAVRRERNDRTILLDAGIFRPALSYRGWMRTAQPAAAWCA